MEAHKVVSHEEWIAARKAHLADEKSLHPRARCTEPQAPRIALGAAWTRTTCSRDRAAKQTLADLFGGKSQLIVYHFMLGPDWEEGCPSCSLLADHFDGAVIHLAQRDVAFVVVSLAPLAQIEKFKRRMGWHFKWVSSFGNDFNFDYHVSATPEEKRKGTVPVQLPPRPSFRARNGRVRACSIRLPRRRSVSHLFELWTRPRHSDRRLQFPRHRTEGPRRRRPALQHGLGAASRQIRGRGRRSQCAVSGTESGRPIGLLGVVLRLIDGGANEQTNPDERSLHPGYRCFC